MGFGQYVWSLDSPAFRHVSNPSSPEQDPTRTGSPESMCKLPDFASRLAGSRRCARACGTASYREIAWAPHLTLIGYCRRMILSGEGHATNAFAAPNKTMPRQARDDARNSNVGAMNLRALGRRNVIAAINPSSSHHHVQSTPRRGDQAPLTLVDDNAHDRRPTDAFLNAKGATKPLREVGRRR